VLDHAGFLSFAAVAEILRLNIKKKIPDLPSAPGKSVQKPHNPIRTLDMTHQTG
jgi:hypothetical protein